MDPKLYKPKATAQAWDGWLRWAVRQDVWLLCHCCWGMIKWCCASSFLSQTNKSEKEYSWIGNPCLKVGSMCLPASHAARSRLQSEKVNSLWIPSWGLSCFAWLVELLPWQNSGVGETLLWAVCYPFIFFFPGILKTYCNREGSWTTGAIGFDGASCQP